MTKEITVLIVDDEQSVREGTKALLSIASGINVSCEARNGQEAVQLVAEQQPDVVLMDVRMPVMDGLEATRRIKASWPQVKVVLLTMYSLYQQGALEAGADRFLVKGRMGNLLEETIRAMTREGD